MSDESAGQEVGEEQHTFEVEVEQRLAGSLKVEAESYTEAAEKVHEEFEDRELRDRMSPWKDVEVRGVYDLDD